MDHFPVLSLQKLCSTKIALGIYNDPEMTALEEKYDLLKYFPLSKGIMDFLELRQSDHQLDGFPYLFRASPFNKYHLKQRRKPPFYKRNRDITNKFSWCFTPKLKKDMHYAEWNNLVLKKISSLSIPKPLHNELLTSVRCTRLEIKKWMSNHREILRCSEETINFHWKSSGKINYEETAKSLIRNEKLDTRTRYALASFYYLKDDAIYLWSEERMSWGEKNLISHDHPCLQIWNNCVKRRSAIEWDNLADNRTGFEIGMLGDSSESWHSHYHLGIRTVFTKLSTGKKIEWLNYSVKYETIDSEDFLFCLSHLEAHHEKENLFRKYPCQVLGYFLDWPLQSEFLEVAESIWSFVSGRIFFFLLHFIIYERIVKEWNDYDYFHLLREFWRRSPIHLKECIQQKHIYQVVMLVVDCDYMSSFYKEKIAKLCANIDYAFRIPRTKNIS
ncbi:uncharacterized protein NPIL_528371 [Nephila pilipes]|uniref:Uncharacterized protein n=1 Tax=Nephila pilipes TaxID=299642 RepID=A0A8X6QU34_NEPPI|nr:uncharacterized protein NPIL_528371 [Nephila pilipes]